MAQNIADIGDVHINIHIFEGGGVIQVTEQSKQFQLNQSKKNYKGEDGIQVKEWMNMGNRRSIAVRPPPIQDDPVHEAPAVRHGGVPAIGVGGVHDDQEDDWQGGHVAGNICDDVPTSGDDDKDHWRLIEEVTKDVGPGGGSARSRTLTKYSPDDHALRCWEPNQGRRGSKLRKHGLFVPGGGGGGITKSHGKCAFISGANYSFVAHVNPQAFICAAAPDQNTT